RRSRIPIAWHNGGVIEGVAWRDDHLAFSRIRRGGPSDPPVKPSVRQLEHVQGGSRVGWFDFRGDGARHIARAAAAKTRGHGDELLVADGKRNREALDRCAESRFPHHLSSLHIERTEAPIE